MVRGGLSISEEEVADSKGEDMKNYDTLNHTEQVDDMSLDEGNSSQSDEELNDSRLSNIMEEGGGVLL